MRNKFFTTFGLFIALVATAAASPYNTFVFGHIDNLKDPRVYLLQELAFTQANWPAIDSVKCDRSGNYKFSLSLKDPLVGAIGNSAHNIRIFLSPGDSLRVDFDIEVWPGSVKFNGKG